jgi:hypothetical protein
MSEPFHKNVIHLRPFILFSFLPYVCSFISPTVVGSDSLVSAMNGCEDVRLFTEPRRPHDKTITSCFVTHVYKMIVAYIE